MTKVINEASLIAYLECDEIIKCEDFYHFNNQMYIMLEYMDQGSMTDILSAQSETYSEDFCKYSLFKVATGLLKMHKNNVLHRDLKSDNIQCSTDGQIKIADFASFSVLTEQQKARKTKKGCPNWIAPEIAQEFEYSKPVDVWSFGCFAYELATGMPPFSNIINQKKLMDTIINQDVPEIPDRWSNDYKDFVKKCLLRDPNERWTIEQLLSDQFLANAGQCKAAWVSDMETYIDSQ